MVVGKIRIESYLNSKKLDFLRGGSKHNGVKNKAPLIISVFLEDVMVQSSVKQGSEEVMKIPVTGQKVQFRLKSNEYLNEYVSEDEASENESRSYVAAAVTPAPPAIGVK